MYRSGQWFVAQAISSIRHGIGSKLAFEVARRAKRRVSPHGNEGALSLQGFAVTVGSATCLAIEDAVGCGARILAGQAWITAEGALRDIIADTGTMVPLESGVRFNVSALRDVTTVLITAPRYLRDVRFNLHKRDGMQVLTIAPGRSRVSVWLSDGTDAVWALARRWFATTETAAV
jgi:hypothetical protein